MNRLIQTYLLHIKSHLPRSLRDDVAAEIEEGLREKIEAREEQAGRKITDDELSEMLTEWGHPVKVAGQYLPVQYLIGPSTFPAYWHALKALVVVFGAIFTFKLVILSVVGNFAGIVQSFGSTLWGLIAWAGILTLGFAVFDAKGFRFFGGFDARRLPEQHVLSPHGPAQLITRFESAFSLMFLFAASVWWFDAFGLSLAPWNVGEGQLPIMGYEIGLGANADAMFYPVAITLIGGIALWGRCFLRPYWTRPALAGRLVLTLAEISILGALLRTPDVITLAVADNAINPEGLSALLPVIVASARIIVIIVIVFRAFGVLGAAARLMRNRA